MEKIIQPHTGEKHKVSGGFSGNRKGGAGAKIHALQSGQKGFVSTRSFRLDFLTFIHTWLILGPAFPLIASAVGLSGGQWWVFNLYGLTIAGAAALSFYLIRKTRKLVLFLAAAGIYLAAAGYGVVWIGKSMSLLAQNALMALTEILCLVVFAFRLSARMQQSRLQQDFVSQHEGQDNVYLESWETPTFLSAPGPIQWIWPTLLYIPAVMASFKGAYRLMFGMMAADVLVMFLFNYMDRFRIYIRDHQRVANMPVFMMQKVHRMLMAMALFLLAAIMLPAICYHTEPLDGVKPDLVIELPEQEAGIVADECAGNEMDWLTQLSEDNSWTPPGWLVDLFRILMYLLLGIAIVGMAWAVWQRFRENSMDYAQEDEDEVIFLDEIAKENAAWLYGGKKKRDGFLSPNAQIRRRFRRAIRKGTVGEPQKWATPEELEVSAKWKQTSEEQVLHELYEKARYSEAGCDRDDLGRLER